MCSGELANEGLQGETKGTDGNETTFYLSLSLLRRGGDGDIPQRHQLHTRKKGNLSSFQQFGKFLEAKTSSQRKGATDRETAAEGEVPRAVSIHLERNRQKNRRREEEEHRTHILSPFCRRGLLGRRQKRRRKKRRRKRKDKSLTARKS